MTGTKSQQPETAQDAYRTLLRTRIAPALRAMGFKGSGNSFSMARGDYEVGINFQKNKWSTRDLVTFDVNLAVVHRANNESFERENVVARRLGKEIEVPTSGNFFSRLSKLGEWRENFPWTVTPAGPNDEVAHDVLESIRLQFLARVEEELPRPLDVPTPATERADRVSQRQINEAALAWHKEALERAGVRNPQRIDVNPETG
jgi:hypothetical protein